MKDRSVEKEGHKVTLIAAEMDYEILMQTWLYLNWTVD